MQKRIPMLVSPLFLFGCFFTTFFLMAVLIYRMTLVFTFGEKPIDMRILTPEKIKEFGGNPAIVHVSLYIQDFYKFDMNNDEFIFNGVLSYEFDPSLISLTSLEKTVLDRGEILHKSAPISRIEHGHIIAKYNVQMKIYGFLEHKWFPFDDHRVSIVFINKAFAPDQLVFKTSSSNFSAPDMSSIGWHKFNSDAQAGYMDISSKGEVMHHPAVLFTIDYGRYKSVRGSFIIILPMLILFFTALFSLIVDPTKNFTFVITMPMTTIAGLITYRFVIESLSPKAIGYFMYSDYFFLFFLTLMFTILLFHAFASHTRIVFRKILILVFNAGVILFTLYLFSLMSPVELLI